MIYRLNSLLRTQDNYGHPINLTYKSDTTYKSTLGGVLSLIAKIGMIIFFIVELKNVFSKQFRLTVTEKLINTAIDPASIHLDRHKFDFAVRIVYQGASDID